MLVVNATHQRGSISGWISSYAWRNSTGACASPFGERFGNEKEEAEFQENNDRGLMVRIYRAVWQVGDPGAERTALVF